jgi:hypothetical protein
MLKVCKNSKTNHKQTLSKIEKKIASKAFSLYRKEKKYHIEEVMKLPKGNPNEIYKKLDSDNRCYGEKFKDILLFPSCYDGLLTCEYYFKILLETNTIFSTDECLIMPIDFYAEEKEEEEEDDDDEEMTYDKLKRISKKRYITPMGNNPGNNYMSPSMTINEVKPDINKNKNIINIPLNKSLSQSIKKSNLSLFEKNDIITDEGGDNEGFDAPPSVCQSILEVKDK